MSLIEWIKTVAIRTTDTVNKFNDPFEDFTRPAFPKEQKKLCDLEIDFYADLTHNCWGCEGQVLLHRIPLPPGSPLDLGDQAIWHGIYTGMLAIRYHLNTQTFDTSRYPAGDATFGQLVEALKGLQLHQTIHGESSPRLIRGISDDLKTWQDDASNDSATGHLFGIYATWKWGPNSLQPVCHQLALGLASELLGNNHALVGPSGKPTTYGALEQGWKTDPLRISLALAVYAVAATITKQPAFMKAYSDLYTRYGDLACYPKAKLWWLDNQNDTHRAAIHLMLLAECTTGEPYEKYVDGLDRIQDITAKDGNVWVNALCQYARGGPILGRGEREIALKVLSEFTLKDKMFNDGKDNANYSDQRLGQFKYIVSKVKWGGTLRARQPVPRWAARSQDFFWQRNLHSLDIGTEGGAPDSRLNGGDFLAAYWMSRLAGILNDRD